MEMKVKFAASNLPLKETKQGVRISTTTDVEDGKIGSLVHGLNQGSDFSQEIADTNTSRNYVPSELLIQREEALKREEAARDRLKLQESIHLKQMQELRAQVKKLAVENLKLQRSSWAGSNTKSDKKKDGKSREVRELNKTIDLLRNENISLQRKLDELAEFIQVAGDIKNEAISQCREKNEMIRRLHEERSIAQKNRNNEIRKRFQVEGELHSLKSYVDYFERRSREKQRSKSVQTTHSIPIRMNPEHHSLCSIGGFGFNFTPIVKENHVTSLMDVSLSGASASYNALTSAANRWKIRSMEQNYRKDTQAMKKRFLLATTTNDPPNQKNAQGHSPIHHEEDTYLRSSKPITSENRSDRCLPNSNQINLLATSNMSKHVSDDEIRHGSLPPPPPPPRPPLSNGSNARQKFTHHSTMIGPAEIVYNSRIEM